MDMPQNQFGQDIGFPLENWVAPALPSPTSTMTGQYCRLEPLNVDAHCLDLFNAFSLDVAGESWTYLPYGPFDGLDGFKKWLIQSSEGLDPLFFTVIDLKTKKAIGLASYLRIAANTGVIEVGHIHFSPLLQRTPMATETMYLMMKHIFDDLGYRRYEWKCDSLNQPSQNAANRLGFKFEGTFRQATFYKGRNRDTSWYSIIDAEWPDIKKALEAWLSPQNFDANGMQKSKLKL